MTDGTTISRRRIVRATTGAVFGLGTVGVGTADSDGHVEVNVGFSNERSRAATLDAASDVVREFAFDVLTIRVPKRATTGLANRPDVRYVEANGQMHALAQTIPTGVDCANADYAHACGETGSDVDIAILDTGIDSDHPDLQANLGAGKAFTNCTGSNCNYAWDDDHNHGTRVAGIAAAVDNSQGVVGVAPDANLHAVKVLDHAGSGTYSDIAAGVEYSADQGWDVINMSLGASSGSQTLHDAIQYADSKGVIMVAAAGNAGPCTNCVGYPAKYSEVVAVAATNDCSTTASYSSTGPALDFLAPGSDVYSTVIGGYDTYSGTSVATPHVSGGVAVVLADGYSNPVQRLCNTAHSVPLCSCCGVIDVAAAVGC